MSDTRLYEAFYLALLFVLASNQAQAQTMKPVVPPDFVLPDVGYYSSYIWPNAGWNLLWTNPGDVNSNPGAAAAGAVMKRTGMYSATGANIVEAWCAPNYYWIYQLPGVEPLGQIFHDASTTNTNGDCFFNVTIGSALRGPIQGPLPPPPPQTSGLPPPTSNTPYAFNVVTFADNVATTLTAGNPAPVGFELAIRDPKGQLVYSMVTGSVTGSSSLPPRGMRRERRFDTASMSKTITATAVVAALEDLAGHKPPLGVTLDSSVVPFVPSNWDTSKIGNVTFRSLLRHTSGFVANGGDTYDDVKTMVEAGPDTSQVGKWNYYDSNYALLRVVLAYLVDGPTSYKPFESNPTLNAELTAMSYRSYVRNRIFDPIGLSGVDDFYTGPLPETIYFDAGQKAIPDNINVPGSGCGYDQSSNNMALTAGSGNWTLSAEEYSLFISSLWLGRIVSPASVTAMLAQDDPNAQAVGIGMYGSQIQHGGKLWWDYNENGGGGTGGPQGIWITFFNGYTAVLLSNTAWGLGKLQGFQLMENSFLPALAP